MLGLTWPRSAIKTKRLYLLKAEVLSIPTGGGAEKWHSLIDSFACHDRSNLCIAAGVALHQSRAGLTSRKGPLSPSVNVANKSERSWNVHGNQNILEFCCEAVPTVSVRDEGGKHVSVRGQLPKGILGHLKPHVWPEHDF